MATGENPVAIDVFCATMVDCKKKSGVVYNFSRVRALYLSKKK
jgi:hypothetical protein